MSENSEPKIFSEWTDEICHYLLTTKILCIAIFDENQDLEFATPVMESLFKGKPSESFINPTFEKLLKIKSDHPLIFQGMITIGDYLSLNSTIIADVYRKNGKLLIIGGVEAPELIDQYAALQKLNQQINNLQRELIKEKITLEKTLDQLNETNEELKLINASKDKFFSIIGHDLKSPFNTILGFSDLLQEQVKEKDYSQVELYSNLIYKSAQKAFDLLVNLMEWAQTQTGRITFKPETFDLVDTVLEMRLLFQEVADKKEIKIVTDLPPFLDIFADKAMINTILRNLISNAIKFTPLKGTVMLVLNLNQHEVVLKVKDNGVGIPRDRIEKLFHIDENYSTKGTNQETGTGLGLIICKEFVEKHQGKIWVESKEGEGSTFCFSIPIIT